MNDEPLKVLLAEGGRGEASVSLRTFSTVAGRCIQSYVVSRSLSLLEALQLFRPDVALLQLLVLQPDPAATVSRLHECAPDVALIIWAEPADKEIAAKCIQAGAKDYMLEGFTDERTLDRVLRTAMAVEEGLRVGQAAQEGKIIAMPRPASLTDGHEKEKPGWARSTVRMRIEVQSFNLLCERDGRFAAEELMHTLALTLRRSVRASDSVASYAAGQLVVTMRDTEASSLPIIRRRIAARLLPFQEFSELRTTLVLSIDEEMSLGSVLAPRSEIRQAAVSPEHPDLCVLARS